jgi:hypothetical protein
LVIGFGMWEPAASPRLMAKANTFQMLVRVSWAISPAVSNTPLAIDHGQGGVSEAEHAVAAASAEKGVRSERLGQRLERAVERL